jgi:hypothetical protein
MKVEEFIKWVEALNAYSLNEADDEVKYNKIDAERRFQMKELEIKEMLADPTVPTRYKWRGRINEAFLDGVEYAERVYEKHAVEVWAARGKDGVLLLSEDRPQYGRYCEDTDDESWYSPESGATGVLEEYGFFFPNLTFENSPRRMKLILEDDDE